MSHAQKSKQHQPTSVELEITIKSEFPKYAQNFKPMYTSIATVDEKNRPVDDCDVYIFTIYNKAVVIDYCPEKGNVIIETLLLRDEKECLLQAIRTSQQKHHCPQ